MESNSNHDELDCLNWCDHKGKKHSVFFADPTPKETIQADGGKLNMLVEYCAHCGMPVGNNLPYWIPVHYSQIEKHGK